MLGTFLNAGAILLGGIVGLTRFEIAERQQAWCKTVIGVATVWYGFKIAWSGLWTGSFGGLAKQFGIVLLAMMLGKILGRLLRLQKAMNRVGQLAKDKLSAAGTDPSKRNEGFIAATLLFCAAPLGIVGAIEDGLAGNFQPLAIKAAMDGLAAMSFAKMFGWRALLGAVPLAAFLLGITLVARMAEPHLHSGLMLESVHAACGFLLLYIALVIFEVKKVELADYLPSLAVAPLLAWLLR
jgi:uncharacterized membrane protein YqgA involved in biofilm formation